MNDNKDILEEEIDINKKDDKNLDNLINEYINNINNLNNVIENYKIELDNLKKEKIDNELRYQAELSNIDKRNKIEIEKIYKFSLENFMSELIIVIDNLERAINVNVDKINDDIIEGLNLTLKSLVKITNKFGLSSIDSINVPFDPSIHQAILTTFNKKYEPNYVIDIIQKGYILNERLIRPAMVQVSCNSENNIEKNMNIDNKLE
ncbi:nucleotide exchange factor GrpE [endosymbiont of Pachyrhynchus infernalis]|uniref:nucleotide exchange factor GrpE n=1 Tax=endosymbiont of Pachyrhynchus infernalis TaxID=1971488 RepID=UPI000DC72A52|nr:nucleotide exchange factor GrpE [endosymbiont of Pachyrhynchus infernalis]BBA84782.1 protein GrpE [endosymbiont of Pachyrhynchus infernalis]